MKEQNGMTPLGWVVTIAIALVIIGVSIAMLFGGVELPSSTEDKNTSTNSTVQTVDPS